MPSRTNRQLGLEGFLGPSKMLRERLVRLAREMLIDAGERGVGFDEVRHAAETRNWLTGHEADRYLSIGSSVMHSAGGVATRWRTSRHVNAKGRRVAVYVHTSFSPPTEK